MSFRVKKIDIIPWNDDAATFIVNALQPAEVAKVVLDEDSERIEVVVPNDQLSLAIGRRGQNVRLASQLTGWGIDIMTEAEESERRQKEFQVRSDLFQNTLNVDEMVSQLLASEGFTSVEEVAYVDLDEISSIEGFDEETATKFRRAPVNSWKNRKQNLRKSVVSLVFPTNWFRFLVSLPQCWLHWVKTKSKPWKTLQAVQLTTLLAGPSVRIKKPFA